MKTGLLALLVAFGIAGPAVAQENPTRPVGRTVEERLATRASDALPTEQQTRRSTQASAGRLQTATLKERERLRKGLPRWWN